MNKDKKNKPVVTIIPAWAMTPSKYVTVINEPKGTSHIGFTQTDEDLKNDEFTIYIDFVPKK